MIKFMKKGFKLSKLNSSNLLIVSLLLIKQNDGKIWAIFNTNGGKNSECTKAPQRKLEPSAITLMIPLIASLFWTIFTRRKAIARAHIVKKKKFVIKRSPCILNITFPIKKKLKSM